MHSYSVIEPQKEIKNLCLGAGKVAALKLDIRPVPSMIFIREDPAGSIKTPRRINGMMDCGDIFVRVAGRTPAQLVKTIFHETHHVKTMREAEQNIFHPSEINEARAEWFAVCEAPVAYGVDELNCALISDGIETFLQRNYVEAASNWIKVLDRKYDREAASIFRTRLLKLQIRA